MTSRILSCVGPILVAAAISAQTQTYFAPSGNQTSEGSASNTIPWWAGSATYQQVHHAKDLAIAFPSAAAVLKGINYRKNNDTATGAARTMDAQITLGITSVSSYTATTTFATNLGASPTVVLPYMNLSLPALTQISVPNPVGWSFPFATPFTYVNTAGNLCYELRFKNSTPLTNVQMDATSGATTATLGTLLGTGCIATGQTTAAAIGSRSFSLITGAYLNRLDRGAVSTPAALFLGVAAQKITMPGFCSSLETLPVVTINGMTDAAGLWSATLTFGPLIGFTPGSIYAQFAFLDAGLTGGLGLSNCSPATILPETSGQHSVRVYAAPSAGGQGNEAATTGTVGYSYGLITGFDI